MLSTLAAIPSPPTNIIQLGPLQLHIYGLCIAIGVLASVSLARRRWADRGGDPEDITSVAIVAVPAGLVGARIYHVITDWPDLYSGGRWWPDAFLIWKGGLGIPGGVLLGAVAALLMARRLHMDWRFMGDAAAPALPLAQAIGRLGNYFNQELFGGPTKLPWGLRVDEQFRPKDSVGVFRYPADTLFHPTFLYEALWNLGLVALIVLLGRKIVLKPGRWFAVYIMGYGLGRLWVESLRIDPANEILGLRVNTWTSALAIIGGALWLFWRGSPLDHSATKVLADGGDPLAGLIVLEGTSVPVAAPATEATAAGEAIVQAEQIDEDSGPTPESAFSVESDVDAGTDLDHLSDEGPPDAV